MTCLSTLGIRRMIAIFALAILFYFTVLMVQISWDYRTLNTDVGFLRIKQEYLIHRVWLVAFFVHALTSALVLLAGFTQFSRSIQTRHRTVHRWLGRVYVFNVLLITGPAGLVMAFYANGGLPARMGFVVLALAWWGTTWMAYRAVRAKQFSAHRRWMVYSFALTLSAITLRLWKMFLSHPILALPPMEAYQMAAWLGFVPNVVVAYLGLRRHRAPPISKPESP